MTELVDAFDEQYNATKIGFYSEVDNWKDVSSNDEINFSVLRFCVILVFGLIALCGGLIGTK